MNHYIFNNTSLSVLAKILHMVKHRIFFVLDCRRILLTNSPCRIIQWLKYNTNFEYLNTLILNVYDIFQDNENWIEFLYSNQWRTNHQYLQTSIRKWFYFTYYLPLLNLRLDQLFFNCLIEYSYYNTPILDKQSCVRSLDILDCFFTLPFLMYIDSGYHKIHLHL